MPRIACLWVPDLPLCAALRAEPRLAEAPLAVVQAGDLGGRAHVLGATPQAFGVEAGQTLAEARAICPQLMHRKASPERERAAAQAALEAAAAVSPRVEEAAPGLVHLDAGGLSRLFGDDRGVARALVAAAEQVGLRAAVGVAAGKSTALLPARAAPAASAFRGGRGAGAGRAVHRAAAVRLEGAARPAGAAAAGARADGARAVLAAPARGRLVGRADAGPRGADARGGTPVAALAARRRRAAAGGRRHLGAALRGARAGGARSAPALRAARREPHPARGGGGAALGAGGARARRPAGRP